MRGRPCSCAFTGHRPGKLPWGEDESDLRCIALKAKLRAAVESAIHEGMEHFICGMAEGCDLYFAETVLALKSTYPHITLEAAIPCPSQADGWGEAQKSRYRDILARCDYETMVQQSYTPGCMQRRNRYMVDHASLLIAVNDGARRDAFDDRIRLQARCERAGHPTGLKKETPMPFDFKKEYREFYLPKAKPEIVTVPCANYIAVRGRGDPNEENGAYQRAIGVLYAVAYTLKMSKRAGHEIDSFFDYVVPPLEGFWQMPDTETVDYGRKSDFRWISVLRLPDFVTKADFDWAVEAAAKKKKLDCSKAEFLAVDEGLCVQILHLGSFDDELESVAKMDAFLRENGYENDLNDVRLHHEIYLSDPRRVAAEKRKTVLRHPIKKA